MQKADSKRCKEPLPRGSGHHLFDLRARTVRPEAGGAGGEVKVKGGGEGEKGWQDEQEGEGKGQGMSGSAPAPGPAPRSPSAPVDSSSPRGV